MGFFHTLKAGKAANNMIKGIGPLNPKASVYIIAAFDYLYNKASNEVLNLIGS